VTRERAAHYRRLATNARTGFPTRSAAAAARELPPAFAVAAGRARLARPAACAERAALIERADFWSRLAKEQDEEPSNVERSVPPGGQTREDQPVAQQQQQVQPKDDEKE
jgi:hypothetical protein